MAKAPAVTEGNFCGRLFFPENKRLSSYGFSMAAADPVWSVCCHLNDASWQRRQTCGTPRMPQPKRASALRGPSGSKRLHNWGIRPEDQSTFLRQPCDRSDVISGGLIIKSFPFFSLMYACLSPILIIAKVSSCRTTSPLKPKLIHPGISFSFFNLLIEGFGF